MTNKKINISQTLTPICFSVMLCVHHSVVAQSNMDLDEFPFCGTDYEGWQEGAPCCPKSIAPYCTVPEELRCNGRTGKCEKCGELGQLCCKDNLLGGFGGWCKGSDLTCHASTCEMAEPCGNAGESCCYFMDEGTVGCSHNALQCIDMQCELKEADGVCDKEGDRCCDGEWCDDLGLVCNTFTPGHLPNTASQFLQNPQLPEGACTPCGGDHQPPCDGFGQPRCHEGHSEFVAAGKCIEDD